MRTFISNVEERNYIEACHLFGKEDCDKFLSFLKEGRYPAARKVIASWFLPLSASCEAVRLLRNCTNEQAKAWYDENK